MQRLTKLHVRFHAGFLGSISLAQCEGKHARPECRLRCDAACRCSVAEEAAELTARLAAALAQLHVKGELFVSLCLGTLNISATQGPTTSCVSARHVLQTDRTPPTEQPLCCDPQGLG